MRLALLLIAAVLAPAQALAQSPGAWESRPPAPAPRQEAAFALVGKSLHLVAGFEYGAVDSLRHDIYDTESQAWTVGLPLPEPAHHVQGAEIGGKLYVVGGLQTLQFLPTGNLWEYDPLVNAWTRRAGLPAGRVRGAGAVATHGGKLYYVGGLVDGGTATGMVDVYDPATDAWSPLADMPTERDHLGVAVVGSKLYAVGGRFATFTTEVAETEVLDLTTGKWSGGLARLPVLRAGFATAAIDGEILTIGGETNQGPHAHVEGYDPATDTWRRLAPMPLPRHGIQGAAHAGGVWIAGGGTDLLVAATASLDVFYPGPRPSPPPAEPPSSAPPPEARPEKPALRMSVRRTGRRVRVTLRAGAGTRVTLRALRGRRTVARRTLTLRTSPQSAVLMLPRRTATRARITVEARSGATTIRRRA